MRFLCFASRNRSRIKTIGAEESSSNTIYLCRFNYYDCETPARPSIHSFILSFTHSFSVSFSHSQGKNPNSGSQGSRKVVG